MDVSIHAPARGATGAELVDDPNAWVSIHAPARGATSPVFNCAYVNEFQSTRPHGARLHPDLATVPRAGVSIHAPARGATEDAMLGVAKQVVSIHAPARGAT